MHASRSISLSTVAFFCVSTFYAVTASADDPLLPDVKFLLTWGSEGTEPGQFNIPIGIAINADDEIFICDHYNNRVQRFDADGKLLAHFNVMNNPGGCTIDADGLLYITHFPTSKTSKEPTPDRVTIYNQTGEFVREFGSSGSDEGQLNWPGGIIVHPNGKVYVADQTNHRVQVFDKKGNFLSKWGEYGVESGQFGGNTNPKSRVGGPNFIAVDSEGNIYTTEASVGRVQKFDADGKFIAAFGDLEDRPGSFGGYFTAFPAKLTGPIGICVDHQDRLWIACVSGRIQQFTRDGKYLRGFGFEQGTEPGQFYAPHTVAVNSKGELYVVDTYNHRVQKYEVPE
ncbi:MAG: hypothetical protein O2955_06945 [Planctomycetota bacterium]|nr:hypothetical protein [Planctomycetota bacterium]MDA1212233.1 hypothetical protein [Planctomycetota bacterium]